MIGKLDASIKQVTVVGGGIAGLIAAYRLDGLGYEVTLIESSNRVGGLITTHQMKNGIAEAAAHSFQVNDAVRDFCDELKIKLLPVKNKARFIFRDGKPRKMPLKFLEILITLFKVCLNRWIFSKDKSQGPTIQEWANRHLGFAATEYLVNPGLRGIYAAKPNELALRAVLPTLETKRGRSLLSTILFRKKKKKQSQKVQMMVPEKGMGSIVAELEARLKSKLGSRFILNQTVTKIPETKNIVLAVPAPVVAGLLESIDSETASALKRVRYSPIVSCTVIYEAALNEAELQGVGVLFPEVEKRELLGVLFNSSAFDGRAKDQVRHQSFTVMLGEKYLNHSDEQIQGVIEKELKSDLGLSGKIVELAIHRWKSAIPKYNFDLMNAWEVARKGWSSQVGHVLFGNYTGQVSLRGMLEAEF